jgi:hypothetical protein
MSVELSWLDSDERVMVVQFVGDWTWDDVYRAANQGAEWTQSKPHTVYHIIDFTRSNPPPNQGFSLVRNLLSSLPANAGASYFVGTDRFIEVLIHTYTKAYPEHAQYMQPASSYEHALELIREQQAV